MRKIEQLRLHEGMIVAMVRKRRYAMKASELAGAVEALDFYRRPKDEDHAPGWQIIRRAKRYPQFFDIEGGADPVIRLRCLFQV